MVKETRNEPEEDHHTIESSKSGQDKKAENPPSFREEETKVIEQPLDESQVSPQPWDRDSNMPPMMMKRWFGGGTD